MLKEVLKKIRITRVEKGFSQDFLATKVGFSQSYYAQLESGKKELKMSQLIKISTVLEIAPSFFFIYLSKDKHDTSLLNSKELSEKELYNKLSMNLIEQYEERIKELKETIYQLNKEKV